MKHFKQVVGEINRSIGFLLFFDSMLNTIVLFLAVYLLLALLNVTAWYAAIPAIIYLGAKLLLNSKVDKKRMVEDEYAPLREKLRTAADNMDAVDNPVVEELHEEVVYDLKYVGLSSFFNTKTVAMRIFITMILSFGVVFTTTLDLHVVDLTQLAKDLPGMIDAMQGKEMSNRPIGDINETEDIYGDSKLAVLGNEQVDIRIQPVNFEVSVREEGEIKQKQFDTMFPDEVAVEQSSALDEKIPEEEQQLVKDYFSQLNK